MAYRSWFIGVFLIVVLAQTPDNYAIYSNLISMSPVVRSGPGNVPTDDEIYLIEATTRTSREGFGSSGGRSMEPSAACIRVPAADEAEFQEILADYNLRKDNAVKLTKQFAFSKPYQLLSTDEAGKFLLDALNSTPQVRVPSLPAPVNPNPLYQKSKRVFRLGDVYFNKGRTLALLYFSVYTTTMDWNGGWRAFRKASSGAWEINRSWATCGSGASR